MLKLIKASIGTKYVNKWSTKMCELSLKAVRTVMVEKGDYKEIDVKRYVRIEKIPGAKSPIVKC